MNEISPHSTTRDAAIERLMRAYGTAVLRICHAYLKDATLAEDAMQETFIKAYSKVDCSTFETCLSEKAWLMKIAINTCKDIHRSAWFRHMHRFVSPENVPDIAYDMTPHEALVSDAVMRLPRKLKEVILLHYYQDMTYDEIASILSISRSAVYNRMTSARKGLQTVLTGEGELDEA